MALARCERPAAHVRVRHSQCECSATARVAAKMARTRTPSIDVRLGAKCMVLFCCFGLVSAEVLFANVTSLSAHWHGQDNVVR